MNEFFDENEFFKYCEFFGKNEPKEASTWVRRMLNLIETMNTVYDAAFHHYNIAKIANNYQHLFDLNTLNNIHINQFNALQTKALINYMKNLPGYHQYQSLKQVSLENHGYVVMSGFKIFRTYLNENNIILDTEAPSPYQNAHIIHEKKELGQILKINDKEIIRTIKI